MDHILLLEPYYGGSHKSFLKGLQSHIDCRFSLLTLPARKWKMRMQLASPWFAAEIIHLVASGECFDAILCSTFLDVAVLRSLLTNAGIVLPLAVYFHENQFSYPGQVPDQGMYQFSAINFTSALCADYLAFNSHFNLKSFLDGVQKFLKKSTDMELRYLVATLRNKATVLYPGMDYEIIDNISPQRQERVPVLVWNHRWEHDKDPETFFETLADLRLTHDFQLIVLGEKFQNFPPVFTRAKELFADRIIHFGYVQKKDEYACLLKRGNIIVSTALHEFFGISVLEGVRAGCVPAVPDRLSYQELFPREYRYQPGCFKKHLADLLNKTLSLSSSQCGKLTEPYNWSNLAPQYSRWLRRLCSSTECSTSRRPCLQSDACRERVDNL